MKKIIFLTTVFYFLFIIFEGCVPVLLGTGVVTGYLTTKDSVSGNIEASFDRVWEVSLSVVSNKAEVLDKNRAGGIIKAKRGKDEIVVKIRELTEHTCSLTVTCRKSVVLANLKLAQDIFTKIIRNLGR